MHAYAARLGATTCKTDNERRNIAIQALNQNLGYVVDHVWLGGSLHP